MRVIITHFSTFNSKISKSAEIRVIKSRQWDIKLDTHFTMLASNFAELIPSEMHLLGIVAVVFIILEWIFVFTNTATTTYKQTQAISNKCQDSLMRNTPAEI